MSEKLFKQFAALNIRNFIVLMICLVWVYAQIQAISGKVLTDQANDTIKSLESIMLIIIGFYLKQNFNLTPKTPKPQKEQFIVNSAGAAG